LRIFLVRVTGFEPAAS